MSEEFETTSRLSETTPSREAINGVAFMGDILAVSTRADVAVLRPNLEGRSGFRAVFECGAHGIIATQSGYFVAPLGPTGLMLTQAESRVFTVRRAVDEPLNFYKTISVRAEGHPEVLACAVRTSGIASRVLSPHDGRGLLNSTGCRGLDIVDVCSLGEGLATPAVGAVGRDGTLVLIGDVLSDHRPVTVKFADLKGTAYRLFTWRGHVILLTSEAVYVLAELAERFLAGEDVTRHPTDVRPMPLEAVDANLCANRWLLAVMNDHVLRIDLELLVGHPPDGSPRNGQEERKPITLSPEWETKRDRKMYEAEELAAV